MTDVDLTVAAAEKIMGWPVIRVSRRSQEYEFAARYPQLVVAPDGWRALWENGEQVQTRNHWDPLTRETDAFMIVDALVARKFGFRLYGPFSQAVGVMRHSKGGIEDPNWCCVLYTPDGTSGVHCHLECARAITIACLKAVGVETEC